MKKINFIDSIKSPIITEKATVMSDQNKTVYKKYMYIFDPIYKCF